MPEKVIPLSVSNVRQLSKDLKTFARKLRQDIPGWVEQDAGAQVAATVQTNISGIPDVDGNYLGTENPNAAVTVDPALGGGHEVVWAGKQIAFVEFGTGATGMGYPGPAMAAAGYHPDPTKKRWVYRDGKSGALTISHGLAPQAPMLHAAILHRRTLEGSAIKILNREVRSAITV